VPLRRLALLCLVACGPAPELHVDLASADAPVPGDSPTEAPAPPVPKDIPAALIADLGAPVPGVRPDLLRLLASELSTFAPLHDRSLLVLRRPNWNDDDTLTEPDLERLDTTTGVLTPWSQPWTPELLGWRPRRDADQGPVLTEVSPDGQRIVVGHAFSPRTLPPDHRGELVAIVVSRADGSEPRCIALGVPSDDPPPVYWSHDSRRLIGDWTLACEPDRRGRPIALHPDRPDTFLVSMPWLDLIDGRSGEIPYRFVYQDRDPLGDLVSEHFADHRGVGRETINLATGAALGRFLDPEGQTLRDPRWVSADAVIVDLIADASDTPLGQRLLFSDGRSVPITGPRWQIYTRLPGDQLLWSRDDGRTVEQGRVDWPTQRVLHARPRPELARFATPSPERVPTTWLPGLGGVLIHDHDTGALHLAAT
jgi:hypothetical protein